MKKISRILIVEDDVPLAEVLEYNLREQGYSVNVAHDGMQGLRDIRQQQPDLVVLDLMLPLIDGISICRSVRAEPTLQETLVLMLTARSEEADQMVGFTAGADDYVTKPFSIKVLLQRITALLRRKTDRLEDREFLVSQGVMIDKRSHQAMINDQVLALTPSEFALLSTFVGQPGRAFTRSELIDVARGEDVIVLDRTIDVHIRTLRKKMGSHAALVQTVRGIGYRFRNPAERVESET